MPLYKQLIINNHTRLFIWKIEESLEQLKNGVALTKECLLRVSKMKSEIHRRGFLSIRHLLREIGYQAKDLCYEENGKPKLQDGKYISISHSFNFSGIIISDIPCGIDLEKQRNKIKLISKKFISPVEYESKDLCTDTLESLTTIWCIKEAVYKLLSISGISLKKHMILTNNKTVLQVNSQEVRQSFKVFFFKFEKFICSYVLYK